MSTLRIAFSGLCTFAFKDHPLKGDGDPPTEVKVILQRLTRARPLSNVASARSEVLDQHFPLLEFALDDFNPASTRKADVHCKPDENGNMTKGICYLNGEELAIYLDGKPMSSDALTFLRHKPGDPSVLNLTQKDRDTLWWMATLQDVFPGNPRINPKILDVEPGSNQPVLARINLSQGYLRTLELTDAPCTVVGASSSSFNQRVGTSFELAVEFENTVEIEMVSNRNGKREKRRLILWGPRRGGDLRIGIMNMEIDRVMGVDPASGPRPESDFSVYADVLQDRVEGPIPFLRQTFPGNPAGNASSTCVPGGG